MYISRKLIKHSINILEELISTYKIIDKEHLTHLWTDIYNTEGKPDWSHILPYYDENIFFKDTVQEIHGKEAFQAMTKRLTDRSNDLKMKILNSLEDDNLIVLEWQMTLSFKKYPNSSIYGMSRVTLNDNRQIIEQRDYYDLWGDIFDNIPRFCKSYRRFMKKKFG